MQLSITSDVAVNELVHSGTLVVAVSANLKAIRLKDWANCGALTLAFEDVHHRCSCPHRGTCANRGDPGGAAFILALALVGLMRRLLDRPTGCWTLQTSRPGPRL